jgi:hypothetical protein
VSSVHCPGSHWPTLLTGQVEPGRDRAELVPGAKGIAGGHADHDASAAVEADNVAHGARVLPRTASRPLLWLVTAPWVGSAENQQRPNTSAG